MSTKVEWKDEISDEQLARVRRYLHLLVHPMNVDSKISSLQRGRGVLVADWFARDILRASESELLSPENRGEVTAMCDQIKEGKEPLDPVIMVILETSEHKLTVVDGFETVCGVYATDWNGTVRAHLLRLPI